MFALLILPKIKIQKQRCYYFLIALDLHFPAIQLNLFFFFFCCYFLCCRKQTLFSSLAIFFFLLCSYQDKTCNFSWLQLLSSPLYLAFSEENIHFITDQSTISILAKTGLSQFYFPPGCIALGK